MIGESDDESPVDALYGIASQLSECTGETAVYDEAISAGYVLFDVERVVVVLRRNGTWISITHTDDTADSPFVPITGPRVEAAIDHRETVLISGVDGTTGGQGSPNAGTALCIPLGVDGALELFTVETFDDEAIRCVELLVFLVTARLSQLALSDEVETAGERFDALATFHRESLTRASHELRTPLTSIIGYMELLLDDDMGALTEDQTELVRFVFRKATELEAAVETLTSTFDNDLATALKDGASSETVGRIAGSGPLLLIEPDTEIGELLATRLRALGYQIRLAVTESDAQTAVAAETPAAILVDRFLGTENGLELATQLREIAGSEIPTALLSIIRDEPTASPQLGISGLIGSDRSDSIMKAKSYLSEMKQNNDADVLLVNPSTADDDILIPARWSVDRVADRESGITAHREHEYDLAVVRTAGDAVADRETVAALRERQRGRRMPVFLSDPAVEGSWDTVGGRLFVQRPLDVNDLTAAVIAARPGPRSEHEESKEGVDR